jgi:hypothetical protein
MGQDFLFYLDWLFLLLYMDAKFEDAMCLESHALKRLQPHLVNIILGSTKWLLQR